VRDFRYGDWQTAINAAGNGANNKPWHQWTEDVFVAPPAGTYQGHTNFMPIMNVLDGGVLFENDGVGYYAKSSAEAIYTSESNYTPGQINNAFFTNQYSVGDSVPVFAINTFYGGQSTQGEEGAEGADIWVMQGTTAYQATIASGGSTGATSLTLSPTAGSGTQGVGRYLIDTSSSKTISAGTISNITNNHGGTLTTFTGNGTSWPVSTINTTTTQAVTSPGVHTITLASTAGITTSTVLVICDASAYETLIPSAVGSGSITANFYAPHSSGAIVAAGGLSGYFLELTADTVPAAATGGTDLRQAFPVVYSSSSTSLAASISAQGTWQAFVPSISTAWANSSGSNGYVLYPGAQVLSVYANGAVGNTFTLMPNTVAWANGDTVELPQHPANRALLGSWNVQSWWPRGGAAGAWIELSGVQGADARGIHLYNSTSTSRYSGGGGNLLPPAAGIEVNGPWKSGLYLTGYGPSTFGIEFGPQAWGTVGWVYPLVVTPSSGNVDYLQYNQANKNWYLSVNSANARYYFADNVSGGGFTVPGHIGSSTADTQGTVAIAASTSATVNFSVAFQQPPICTLTPTSDPTSVGTYWVTSTISSFTVNVHTAGTITFNYICIANPN
jgi:hypothetical protein